MDIDTVVRALRSCSNHDTRKPDCDNCPLFGERLCVKKMLEGAADLIESLQVQLAEAQRRERAAVEELEAEREALDALKNNGFCDTCTGCHAPHDPNTITWCESWQWRGQQAGKGARTMDNNELIQQARKCAVCMICAGGCLRNYADPLPHCDGCTFRERS